MTIAAHSHFRKRRRRQGQEEGTTTRTAPTSTTTTTTTKTKTKPKMLLVAVVAVMMGLGSGSNSDSGHNGVSAFCVESPKRISRRTRDGPALDLLPWTTTTTTTATITRLGSTRSASSSATTTTTTAEKSQTTEPHQQQQQHEDDNEQQLQLQSLTKLTVPELKQRVKENLSSRAAGQPRGILSRLKRKQDFIDFLLSEQYSDETLVGEETKKNHESHNNYNSSDCGGEKEADGLSGGTKLKRNGASSAAALHKDGPSEEVPSLSVSSVGRTKDTIKKDPLNMPRIKDEEQHQPNNNNNNNNNKANNENRNHNGAASPSPQTLTLKEALFERVFQRFPVLRETSSQKIVPHHDASLSSLSSANDEDQQFRDNNNVVDLRQWQHPIYTHNNVTTDMDLIFVGTASCTPGLTRGVSCTALRLNWRRPTASWNAAANRMEHGNTNFVGGTWLFDVGECTQLQVQRTSSVRPSKITKIFLTHAHGDHTFGLPGLLCLMGQDYNRDGSQPPVEIYGPEGLRMWLRVAIRYSVSRIVPPYRVHELMDLPMAPEWEFSPRARRFFYRRRPRDKQETPLPNWGSQGLAGEDPSSWISQANSMPLEASTLYGEIDGGRDIYPQYDHPLAADGAPVYEVEDEEDVKVYAAPMSHGIPCVGYVVDELPRPGRLRNEIVEPIVKRNVDALREAGFRVPMKAMAVIKNLPEGASFTFPDGTVVTQDEAVEPQRQGRKVVICGDTCSGRALANLAKDADVLVHEATNAYLEGLDRDTNARIVERDAIVHGHSTPTIAARLAQSLGVKRLVLNHFSARYKGDASLDSISIMQRIEEQAIRASKGYLNETEVAAAWDLMLLPVPHR